MPQCILSIEELPKIICVFSAAYAKLGLSPNLAQSTVFYQRYPATLASATYTHHIITISDNRLKVVSKFNETTYRIISDAAAFAN